LASYEQREAVPSASTASIRNGGRVTETVQDLDAPQRYPGQDAGHGLQDFYLLSQLLADSRRGFHGKSPSPKHLASASPS
jgi:hypothetical protein